MHESLHAGPETVYLVVKHCYLSEIPFVLDLALKSVVFLEDTLHEERF
jgi:hypothetical protein